MNPVCEIRWISEHKTFEQRNDLYFDRLQWGFHSSRVGIYDSREKATCRHRNKPTKYDQTLWRSNASFDDLWPATASFEDPGPVSPVTCDLCESNLVVSSFICFLFVQLMKEGIGKNSFCPKTKKSLPISQKRLRIEPIGSFGILTNLSLSRLQRDRN